MSARPEVPGVTHRRVRARGVEFHVAEAGAGEDVVLCLHGWPQHWYEWRHLMPALADRHRVLALDLRGFGESEAPRRGYEKEEMASDVLAVLDELGVERVKLVGHDWGGWIGFLLCLREPQRFERFLALNIVPPWVNLRNLIGHAWRFTYQQLILAPGLGYRLHRRGDFVRRVLVGASTDKECLGRGGARRLRRQPRRAGAGAGGGPGLPRLQPARGAADRPWPLRQAAPERADAAALRRRRLRPAALDARPATSEHAEEMRVELVPGCGHFIADERPDLVAARAREFFA